MGETPITGAQATDRKTKPRHTGHFPEPYAGDIRSTMGGDIPARDVAVLVEDGLRYRLLCEAQKLAPQWVEMFLRSTGEFSPCRASGEIMFAAPLVCLTDLMQDDRTKAVRHEWSLHMADVGTCTGLFTQTGRLSDHDPARHDILHVYGGINRLHMQFRMTRFGTARVFDEGRA